MRIISIVSCRRIIARDTVRVNDVGIVTLVSHWFTLWSSKNSSEWNPLSVDSRVAGRAVTLLFFIAQLGTILSPMAWYLVGSGLWWTVATLEPTRILLFCTVSYRVEDVEKSVLHAVLTRNCDPSCWCVFASVAKFLFLFGNFVDQLPLEAWPENCLASTLSALA